MADYFALLGLARLPWLDPGEVKKRFLQRSADLHPDRLHGAGAAQRTAAQERFIELNAACNCLSDTAARLQHLLELEGGGTPGDIQDIPPSLAPLLFRCGELCRRADAWLGANHDRVDSPMLKLERMREAMEQADQLENLRAELGRERERLEEVLRGMNRCREEGLAAGPGLGELELRYREAAFLRRWSAQVQERSLRLSFPP
jgi:curved DNA-binding protein CbpA